jgi:peptidoglycan-associated lipoprotein
MKSLLSLLVGIAAVSLLAACSGNPPPATPAKTDKPVAAAEKPADSGTPAPATKDLPRTDDSNAVKIKAVDEKGKVLELKTVYFDFDKYNIRTDQKSAIDANAKELNKIGNAKFIIEGHCDERGTTEYNLALGEHRAVAVMHALEGAGVGKSRLKTISYGKERPADPGHDEAAWAKNRRSIVRES